MRYQTFLEVMAGPEGIRLNHSQKRVLRKTIDAGDPRLAAEQLAAASDNRNLMAASKVLAKYGYITTDPYFLKSDDEPQTIELTDKGQQAVEDYDIQQDPTLVTPEEQAESEPEGQPPTAAVPSEAGGAADLGASEPTTELGGTDVGLELSSFFHEINDLANLQS